MNASREHNISTEMGGQTPDFLIFTSSFHSFSARCAGRRRSPLAAITSSTVCCDSPAVLIRETSASKASSIWTPVDRNRVTSALAISWNLRRDSFVESLWCISQAGWLFWLVFLFQFSVYNLRSRKIDNFFSENKASFRVLYTISDSLISISKSPIGLFLIFPPFSKKTTTKSEQRLKNKSSEGQMHLFSLFFRFLIVRIFIFQHLAVFHSRRLNLKWK